MKKTKWNQTKKQSESESEIKQINESEIKQMSKDIPVEKFKSKCKRSYEIVITKLRNV